MRDSLRDRTSLDNNRSPIRRKISTTNVAPESSKSLKEQPFEIGKPDCVSDIGFSFDAETDLFCNRSACLFDLVQIAKSRETAKETERKCIAVRCLFMQVNCDFILLVIVVPSLKLNPARPSWFETKPNQAKPSQSSNKNTEI